MYNNKNSNIIIHFMLCKSYKWYTHVNSHVLTYNICKQYFSLLYEKLVYILLVESLKGHRGYMPLSTKNSIYRLL